jgi:hypothetical protein
MNGETTPTRRPIRCALVLGATLGAVMLVLAGSAGGMGKYTDPTGDSGSAPDITGVTVASDQASGQIVFHVDIASLPRGADVRTWLYIDSDANPVTGDVSMDGSDYGFVVDQSDNSYGFGHWYGSDWENAPYSTVRVISSPSGVTISVNRSELGNTSEFNFWAESETGDGSAGKWDGAPDEGQWNYSLEASGPHVTGVTVATAPISGPRAGQRFAVTKVALQLPPTGGLQKSPPPDSYTCTATLAGRQLAGSGQGGCAWKVPKKKVRGKRLVVKLTAQYQGVTKTIQFPFVVR